jgi:hypothetical protein
MKALMCAAVAILAGAIGQTTIILYFTPASWLYDNIAGLLPYSWVTPIVASSILSAPFGVVVTLVFAGGLRQTADDCG